MKQLAEIKIAPEGGFTGFGPLGNPGSNPVGVFATFISSMVGLLTIIAIIWFIFVFVTGAIGIISSGGDKQALETARKKITTGILGLIVVVAAIFIIKLIGVLIGIPNILNLQELFCKITNCKT